uniref:Uncharacterized protein n=1 Tax=Aegilops tauschii subsp. strangulata TaxID=200361 RepID=A0A453DXL0_AEGTS
MREAFCPPPKSCRHCFFFDEKAGPLLFIAAIVDLQSSSCFDAAAADQLNSLAPMILFHSDLDPTDTLRVAAPAPLQGPVLQVIVPMVRPLWIIPLSSSPRRPALRILSMRWQRQ